MGREVVCRDPFTRRSFISDLDVIFALILFFSMKVVAAVALILISAPSPVLCQQNNELRKFEFSHGQMGTIFNIICYSKEEKLAVSTVQRAFLVIDSLNQVFSDYVPDSELNKLCSTAGSKGYTRVSQPLFDVINKSLKWSRRSHGAFDITVGPYTQLWRRAMRQEKMPDSLRLVRAAQSVGYRYIRLRKKDHSIRLLKPGMQLDLGGIAKGYTVDKVYEILAAAGLPVSLVDGGGDIYAGAVPPDEKGWKVAFQDLEKNTKFIFLDHKAIATSGDLYRYFEYNGVKYSHIIDPKTGKGITIQRTVSIIAANATDADALATTLSILGPDKGLRLLKRFKEVEALIIQVEKGQTKRYESSDIHFSQ